MSEFVEIYSSSGNKTGKKVLLTDAHRKGFPHATVHLWLFTNSGNLVIQKRSINKKINPNIWDIISVAGHVKFGESIDEAVIREAKEELNLKVLTDNLKSHNVYFYEKKYNNLKDAEFHHSFSYKISSSEIDLNIKNNEVSEVSIISIKNLKGIIKNNTPGYLVFNEMKGYYTDMISIIEKEITES
jgi:isopentenyldiphosphate isomerase